MNQETVNQAIKELNNATCAVGAFFSYGTCDKGPMVSMNLILPDESVVTFPMTALELAKAFEQAGRALELAQKLV